ncbi:putative isoflavone oxidoreductase [Athelia psychrophila]|uniref:Isoflavone oxidoreductase n=1 Tax=Athelia psychrophila TaxID=1759441 RepID=A0A167VBI6_9AGAM|nr:putative isoflavone oxidoreductase [Fibularhizoctonia sp. CBS 109695]
MTSTNENILVLGAGELGTPILRELATRWANSDITLLVRPATLATTDAQKRSEFDAFRSLGIHFLPGDLVSSSVAELAALFKAYHTVIGAVGYVAGPGTQLKLAHAVLQAGVARYFPWQFGVDYAALGRGSAQELFDEQLDVRALLAAPGQTRTEWVIVSTGVFTNYLFVPFFGVVDTAAPAVHALGSLENRITVTTVEDIGRLTAEIVHAEPRIQNAVVYTAGETVSYAQLADIVEAALGRPVQRFARDLDVLKKELEQNPEDVSKKYAVVFAGGKGVAWDMRDTFNFQRGIPVVSAREWALTNLK